jgi:TatD DNase family protein
MYFIDTHAHLDMIRKLSPDEAVNRSEEGGVKYIINVGSSMEGSIKSLEYAKRFPGVFAGIGLHPHHAEGFDDEKIKIIESLIKGHNEESGIGGDSTDNVYYKVLAVGETGFDFFRNPVPRTDQERAFRSQIEIAIKYDLPVIIHNRDADKQTLKVVNDYKDQKKFRAVIHCFSGGIEFARECLEQGLFISYTGIITFPNAGETLEVVKEVPIEKIFIETDSPFLAPQPVRGKENFPGYVKHVAEKIAEIKNMPLDEVAKITSRNAENFFGMDSIKNIK